MTGGHRPIKSRFRAFRTRGGRAEYGTAGGCERVAAGRQEAGGGWWRKAAGGERPTARARYGCGKHLAAGRKREGEGRRAQRQAAAERPLDACAKTAPHAKAGVQGFDRSQNAASPQGCPAATKQRSPQNHRSTTEWHKIGGLAIIINKGMILHLRRSGNDWSARCVFRPQNI